MTLSFVVVCEAEADQRTACELADRVFLEELAWLEPEFLPSVRQWRGLDDGETHTPWHSIPRLAREQNIVLAALCGGDKDREAECWRSTEWNVLQQRGQSTGLADYLAQVRRNLVPLFSPRGNEGGPEPSPATRTR